MYLIFGLGNPGKKFDNSRHNIGFEVIDKISQNMGIKIKETRFRAFGGEGFYNTQKLMLMKPTTYMNLSGEAVRDFVHYYKLDESYISNKLIVIYDDIDLPTGKLRIRPKGSAGTHNGMKNIIYHLETDEFIRVRVGVGAKPQGADLSRHVLGHFTKDEAEDIAFGIIHAADAVADIISQGLNFAMNKYNASA